VSGSVAKVDLSRADQALFRPVRSGNAFEETVERLLQVIKLGVTAPGDRLPAERDLAAGFNISRATLREAIRALQDSGYVESRRGRYGGTFVSERLPRARRQSPRQVAKQMGDHIDDALVLRDVLEVGAAQTAAQRQLSAEERQQLRQRLDETAAATLTHYRRMDSRLHIAIAEATGSRSLTSSVAEVRMQLNELLDAIPLLEHNIDHSNRQHDAIIDAILAGDGSRARQAMAEHVAGTAALLRGFLS
jgi:DNA-binding FadR family transcriptional regulator